MKRRDLYYARGVGGIRPQIVDIEKKQMMFGEAKIIGENIIFDITPSPGASVCLKNAEENVREIIRFFGKKYAFDEKAFFTDLKKE